MPKIADIEVTPNPNARKFILREPLSWGIAHAFDSAEEAESDTLAKALFAITGVTNVFYVDHWLTVTQDGMQEWSSMLREFARHRRRMTARRPWAPRTAPCSTTNATLRRSARS